MASVFISKTSFCNYMFSSYMFYTTHNADIQQMEMSSITPQICQLVPDTRDLCSLVCPESCTANHKSPLCGESSLEPISECWMALESSVEIKSCSKLKNGDLFLTHFLLCSSVTRLFSCSLGGVEVCDNVPVIEKQI